MGERRERERIDGERELSFDSLMPFSPLLFQSFRRPRMHFRPFRRGRGMKDIAVPEPLEVSAVPWDSERGGSWSASGIKHSLAAAAAAAATESPPSPSILSFALSSECGAEGEHDPHTRREGEKRGRERPPFRKEFFFCPFKFLRRP
jgi:hypothetical protein